MSNQLDDFLISLGFDTKKVKSQLNDLQKSVQAVADKIDKKREVAGKKAVKQKLTDEQIVQRAIEKRQLKELKREEDLLKLAKKKAQLSKDAAMSVSKVESARRQQEVRALINAEKNPQLKAMGNHYRQMQSSLLGSKRLETRRRGIVNTVRNVGAYRDFAATAKGSDERKLLAQILLQARKDAREDKYYRVRQLRADLVKRGRDSVSGGMKAGFDISGYRQTQLNNAIGMGQIGKGFQQALERQLAKATTKSEVNRTIGTVGRISRMRGADAGIVGRAENVDQLKRYGEQLARNNAELNSAARRSFGLAAAQGSLRDSTRNLVREYASLYAVFAGTVAIKEQVKAMDGARAGLAAVSSTAEEAAYHMEFIKQTAMTNGLAIADAAKDYVKLKAAIGDTHTLKETEDMFLSITKAGVVFQLSQDDMKGVLRATQQMFSKTKITAEELRNQLGDRLPITMRALQKSTGKTAGEIEKMLQLGELGPEYIKPFIMALGDLASANGAYEKALGKVGTIENQMKTSAGVAADRIGDAGFTEGLKDLYKDLTKAMSENGRTLDQLGRLYKVVFGAISALLNNIVVPAVQALGNAFDGVVNTVKLVRENLLATGAVIAAMIGTFSRFMGVVGFVGKMLAAAFRGPLLILTAIVAAFEEIQAMFDADLIGIGENQNASQKDRDIATAYFKNSTGTATEADKRLLAANKDYIPTAVSNAGGAAAGIMGIANMANSFANSSPVGFITGSSRPQLPSASYTVNQTVYVDGRVSDDNIAKQITEETKKAFSFNMASNF